MIQVPHTSIATLSHALQSGQFSSCELIEQCLSTITEIEPSLNAYITVLRDDARAEAQAADRAIARGDVQGPLHGLPISIKDIIDVKGVATSAASHVRKGHLANTDATVVARLRAAGAIVIGKCNLHEFAFGTTGEDSLAGPTRNPHSPTCIPGGSSSGSAVSVAADMAVASLGTDTGGSIRIPASACGVVGLKPTFGEACLDGVVPLAPTLDHLGLLTRTVGDAALLYHIIRDNPNAIQSRVVNRKQQTCFGIPRQYFLDVIDPAVANAFEHTVRRLKAVGASVVDVDIPHAAETAPVYLHTQLPEAATCHQYTLKYHAEEYCPRVRARLELGRYVLAEDYLLAQRGRTILTDEVDTVLINHDALLLPTLPIVPPMIGTDTIAFGQLSGSVHALMLRLTQLFNLTGHPAISIPSGVAGGLPVGMQLVGRRHNTDELLEVAKKFEDTIRG